MQLKKPFDGNYPITQKFGEKYTNEAGHNGIDYALPMGTPVLAAADGIVHVAGIDNTGYGNYVIIKHTWNAGTLYGHLRNWNVIPGQSVKAGDIVGYSGNSGNSTGPHLHFEYRLKYDDWKSAIDPMPMFRDSEKPVATDLVKAAEGKVVVVAPAGVRVRQEPHLNYGKVLGWARKDDRYKKTGVIVEGSGLQWAEVIQVAYIAIQDADGTQLLRDVEEIYE